MRVDVRSFGTGSGIKVTTEVPLVVGLAGVVGAISTIVYIRSTGNRAIKGVSCIYINHISNTLKLICSICDHQNKACDMGWCSADSDFKKGVLENGYFLWPKIKGSTWLEDTLKQSQNRFQKLPDWVQESVRSEEARRRTEAMELYKGVEETKERLSFLEVNEKVNEKHEEVFKAMAKSERDDLLYALQEPSRQSIAYYTELGELKLEGEEGKEKETAATVTVYPDFFCIGLHDKFGLRQASSRRISLTDLLKIRDFIDQIVPELLKQRDLD